MIKDLLDQRDYVTETRKALSEGLESETGAVSWGSARCLWEVGSRTDPHLASAIIQAGLSEPSRKGTARLWLLELLSQPFTAARAIPALEEAASRLEYRATGDAASVRWEISDCLLAAGILDADHMATGIVDGGLSDPERHGAIVEIARSLIARGAPLSAKIETRLWSALERRGHGSESVVVVGAAGVLIEAECPSVLEVMRSEDYQTKKRGVSLIRALLSGAKGDRLASKGLHRLLQTAECGLRAREALVELLDDEDDDVAYAAARCLVGIDDTGHRKLPTALIRGGLTHYERRAETVRTLDELRSHAVRRRSSC